MRVEGLEGERVRQRKRERERERESERERERQKERKRERESLRERDLGQDTLLVAERKVRNELGRVGYQLRCNAGDVSVRAARHHLEKGLQKKSAPYSEADSLCGTNMQRLVMEDVCCESTLKRYILQRQGNKEE